MGNTSGWRTRVARRLTPFPDNFPAAIRTPLIQLQYARLHRLTPLLYITIAANTVAMALALMGELPLWQQAIPPAILLLVSLGHLCSWRRTIVPVAPDTGYRALQQAVFVAAGLGLVSGVWTVNAFRETEQYYCIVAPVFLALSVLVSANCLTSVPRAATAAMVVAVAPIVVRMLIYDNLGIRTMAVMLVMIVVLQHWLTHTKFDETIKMLMLQHEIVQLAEADVLTGLKNRRAFIACVEALLTDGRAVTVAMIDLDKFKRANDEHGHHAGDAVLIGVAERLGAIAVSAACIARLGGDEFALVFSDGVCADQIVRELDAVRATIALPFAVDDATLTVAASIGVAHSLAPSDSVSALMKRADRMLYIDKRRRRSEPYTGNDIATLQRA